MSSVFQENFKKKVFRVHQDRFNVLFSNFVVACVLSQLPEQKEGLFLISRKDNILGMAPFLSIPHQAIFWPKNILEPHICFDHCFAFIF